MASLMEAASSMVRSALTVAPGKKMVSSDLANIEGRVGAWLAGESWKVQAFKDFDAGKGPDLYIVGAARVLGKDPKDVTPSERQGQGKVPELACLFQGAVGAFHAMAKVYGLDMSDARALEIVKGWRKANPNTVNYWYALERAAVRATETPGLQVECDKLVFRRDGSWLRMRLPSGRFLCYPGVGLEDGKLTYMGTNQYSRQWERLHTYGGKLFENACQATARDVMAWNMPEAEKAGFDILMTIHDEIVAETDATSGLTHETLSRIMSTVPPWATGLPLAASGWEGQRYRK